MKAKEGKVMNEKQIGTFIKEKRIEKNLTQQELAERLFVTNKTVSKWEYRLLLCK